MKNKVGPLVQKMAKHLGPLGGLNLFSPGPGTYKVGNGLSQKSYSIGKKTVCPGKYFISKYKSSSSMQFNPLSSKRFQHNKKDQYPGPGQYPIPQSIANDGKYIVSKYISNGCRFFPRSKRLPLPQGSLQNPGPGDYRIPSEFGYYETKRIVK
ncbi:hypothetical protein IMG5_105450 [Ichthyophthirius multifiliis]|uniref:Uncharacterized protein n=1 Tax=Ichthyophthirius multifiliis TaxID=5932 RepID=G0QT16_ICHMU|nr:hypothetical protein IMG5_105450 [Ichthyophthirius multifiliis]EGR31633.1 hypothetical protein IMG5_105450 [Ichthyophthirius multifiliis]|eukprot:XP_004035119.1 hypothetical protein IMG5_105450 [Ichthyophthirius multifiliis]